jgi:hypothetical protein
VILSDENAILVTDFDLLQAEGVTGPAPAAAERS